MPARSLLLIPVALVAVALAGTAWWDGREAATPERQDPRAVALVSERSVGIELGASRDGLIDAAAAEDLATRELAAEAARRALDVPEDAIAARERSFAEAVGGTDLDDHLRAAGSDLGSWRAAARDEAAVNALREALIAQAPAPAEAEVVRRFAAGVYRAPAERETITIVSSDLAGARDVVVALGAGVDPGGLARDRSVHVTASAGGRMLWQDPDGGVSPDPALWDQVLRLVRGAHTRPAFSPELGGVAVVLATTPLRPPRPLTLDQARGRIERQLALEHAEAEMEGLRGEAFARAGVPDPRGGGGRPESSGLEPPRVIATP